MENKELIKRVKEAVYRFNTDSSQMTAYAVTESLVELSPAMVKGLESAQSELQSLREENKKLREVAERYSVMTAVCQHDDPSWCTPSCRDGGRFARKTLELLNPQVKS